MRNGNFLKVRVSEIRVKQIRVNQGLGVRGLMPNLIKKTLTVSTHEPILSTLAKVNMAKF